MNVQNDHVLTPDIFGQAASIMEEKGHVKGKLYGPNGEVCEEGAVLSVVCTPGDQYMALAVLRLRGGGAKHNDAEDNTAEQSLALLRQFAATPITEAEMVETFGPGWKAVRSVVWQAAVMTEEQAEKLAVAWDARQDTGRHAAWGAGRKVARDAGRVDAWGEAWYAALGSAEDAARYVAWCAGLRSAVVDAAAAFVVCDLVGQYGLREGHIETLLGPWVGVFGDPRVTV